MSDRPGIIWIASYPKSGNTWTRALLHNLIGIMYGESDGPQSINKMTKFTSWEISAKLYEKLLGKPAKEADRAEIAAVRPKVQAQIADRDDGLALIKTHNALLVDRGVPTINFSVTSEAIYIVRNPLDVVISYSHHIGRTIDETINAMAKFDAETPVTERTVHEVYGSWSQHVESWTGRPHRAIYVMRYEDMLENPSATFGALARHLLLAPSAAQLDRAIELSSFDQLKEQEQKEGFREKSPKAERFFREGRSGQRQEQLSKRQIDTIVATHQNQMLRFAYPGTTARAGQRVVVANDLLLQFCDSAIQPRHRCPAARR